MQSVQLPATPLPTTSELSDEALVARVVDGATEWFAVLMRRYNGRLFRVARSVTGDDDEAEDAVQQAYLLAYRDLSRFRGESRLSTWLTTIVLREALQRKRGNQRRESLHDSHGRASETAVTDTPEDRTLRRQLQATLEAAVDTLPEHYRTVFVMRDVEEFSGAETAQALHITEETVRVRLHRARALMRQRLDRRLGTPWTALFEFGGWRCDRMVRRVWEAIVFRHGGVQARTHYTSPPGRS